MSKSFLKTEKTYFQERLQELIDDNNINKIVLAKKLDIPYTTIKGYFNDNRYPQINIATTLADYFGCSLDYLFGLSYEYTNKDKNKRTFFTNLDKLRKDFKLSVYRIMRDLKMSEYTYYRWKKGMYPKTLKIIEIAKYFNVSVDYLVGCGK